MLLPIEDVDLVVAMCAVSAASDDSFKLMKDTVKSIVDKYGTSKIHYSVVLYGSQAVPMLRFSDKALTIEEFKGQISILPKPKGNIYEEFIDRGYYAVARRYEFYVRVARAIFIYSS